jgi:two-component system nitrogen regulation sensor histidine kinase NtrY
LAVAPAILVVVLAAVFFYFGVETWFSNHVKTSLNESLEVAQAYLEEHKQVLRADAMAMANDLDRQALLLSQDPVRFNEAVSAQAYLRNLTEVLVFDGTGKILARSGLTFALTFEPITDEMRLQAAKGDVVLLVSDNDDRVRALTRLNDFVDTYLFVGRPVEPKVLAHMAATQSAVAIGREAFRLAGHYRFDLRRGGAFAAAGCRLVRVEFRHAPDSTHRRPDQCGRPYSRRRFERSRERKFKGKRRRA